MGGCFWQGMCNIVAEGKRKRAGFEREACEVTLARKPKQPERGGHREGRHSSLWAELGTEPAAGPDVRPL